MKGAKKAKWRGWLAMMRLAWERHTPTRRAPGARQVKGKRLEHVLRQKETRP